MYCRTSDAIPDVVFYIHAGSQTSFFLFALGVCKQSSDSGRTCMEPKPPMVPLNNRLTGSAGKGQRNKSTGIRVSDGQTVAKKCRHAK